MLQELQPVILAAGEGSKMYPLTEDMPKCLVPIGNYPMIWFVIKYLEKYGFHDIIIIVRHSAAQKVSHILQSLFHSKMHFDICPIPDEEDMGTSEALVSIKDKIKTDILLLSCDMLTEVPLHRLVDLHRTYDTSMTVLVVPRVEVTPEVEQTKSSKNKSRDPYAGQRDFIAVDEQNQRLLFLNNEADIESESISIKKSLLRKYPHMKISTHLIDAHVYILKKWVIDYMSKMKTFESIKSDLVPVLVRKQFSKNTQISKISPDTGGGMDVTQEIKDFNERDIFNYAYEDDLTQTARHWSSYPHGEDKGNVIRCHALISNQFCLRVNTLPSYTYINKQILKLFPSLLPGLEVVKIPSTVTRQEKAQIGADCLVGDSADIGENTTIKKSVIGKHCKIGSRVRITNSIIMNHVTIKDGCTVQGSVVCENSYIKEGCSINNCQVAGGQTVKENSDLKNEAIIQEEMDFDDDDDE